jgi:hypothetical protein
MLEVQYMQGYITAEEAAEQLGYDYTYFLKLLREGKVEGAEYWCGYAVPKSVSASENVVTSREYKRAKRQREKAKSKGSKKSK